MTAKQKIRYAVDLGMTALLPLLMAYSLVGEAAHEWLGMTMLALFIVHHCLNRKWLKNLPNGRYSGFRILQTALAVLILLLSGCSTAKDTPPPSPEECVTTLYRMFKNFCQKPIDRLQQPVFIIGSCKRMLA